MVDVTSKCSVLQRVRGVAFETPTGYQEYYRRLSKNPQCGGWSSLGGEPMRQVELLLRLGFRQPGWWAESFRMGWLVALRIIWLNPLRTIRVDSGTKSHLLQNLLLESFALNMCGP
jgi:hypothetical protein